MTMAAMLNFSTAKDEREEDSSHFLKLGGKAGE
jgi:hypothetical protein